MARQTRAQRRARREARDQQPQAAARPHASNGPERRPPHDGPRPAAAPHREKVPFRFIRESWGELQKVEWPNQSQLVQGTIVVLVACIIVGIYLWLADQAFRRLVQHVLLGQ